MLLFITIFAGLFVVILIAVSAGFMFFQQRRRSAISGALKDSWSTSVDAGQQASVLESSTEPALAFLHGPTAEKITKCLQQAGMAWRVSQLILFSAAGAVIGLLFGGQIPFLLHPALSRIAVAAVLAALPWGFVAFKRKKRLAKIEQHLPEALDFLARSMRAGHAFTISLQMLGEETPEPLGAEIRTVYNEQNLGAPLEVALENFANRIPLMDVGFFVSTVLLQRQTGGNLSEVLIRLAHVIRERFKLKGQVKAVSAHGRITAGVLTAMPIFLAFGLMSTSPEYLKDFSDDPVGRWLLIGVVVGQLIGYLFVRKIVNIKV